MKRNVALIKGPRETAQHAADHRERMNLRRANETRDQAELAEYATAMRAGDELRAQEIAVRRYNRSRAGFDQPMGVLEAERAKAEMAAGPGPSGEGVAQRSPGPVASAPAPKRPSMASQYLANQRRRGPDGRFNPRSFVRQVEKIGQQLRDARVEDARDGAK